MGSPPYFKRQPDGTYIDVRYWCRPGDRVRVIAGSYKGRTGTPDTIAIVHDPAHYGEGIPAYNVLLDGDDWPVVIHWNQMARLAPARRPRGAKPRGLL